MDRNRARLPLAAVLLVSGIALAGAPDAVARGPRLVRVPVSGRDDVERIARWGVEIVEARRDALTLAVPHATAVTPKVDRALSRMPGTEVVCEDVDRLFAAFRDRPEIGAYHTLDEVNADLDALAAANPAIARVESIGKSVDQRDVRALRITGPDPAPWGRPVFLFMGAHHAREWISVEVPLAIARWLVEGYATDPAVKGLVDTREVWIVPAVNPDGLAYSQNEYRYWRKNRRSNPDGSFGVDPNRNYGYKWGTSGTSDHPGSDVYCGPSAFSEPETRNVREFAIARNLTVSISYHSYGESILFPWSYGYEQSADHAALQEIARQMASQSGYDPMQSVELYPSSGDTDDYLYGETGALPFTTEVGRSFIPEESQIAGICAANLKAVRWLLENAAETFPFVKHSPPAPPAAAASGSDTVIVADFDRAHHQKFDPVEVKLVVTSGGTAQELAMAADPAQPDRYAVTLREPAAPSMEYFFGLRDKDGKVARCPRLGQFSPGGAPAPAPPPAPPLPPAAGGVLTIAPALLGPTPAVVR
jgi:murein tripeptide amidase MpaA